MIENISIETIILVFGLLILLAGLFGKIESKWFNVGTENYTVRLGAGIIGFILILYSIIAPQFAAKNKIISDLQKKISAYSNMDDIESRHIDMLQRFMRDHRKKIDDFVLDVWVPVFLDKANQDQTYQKDLQEIIVADIPGEVKVKQLQLTFVNWHDAVQREIERIRDKLIEPLYRLEREIVRKARESNPNTSVIANALDESEEAFSIFDQSSAVGENIDQFLKRMKVINERLKID